MLITPKGIRRGNPCNLMCTTPRQGWVGAVSDADFDGDREEAFISAFWGLRAAGVVLLHDETKRGLWTVREIWTAFAPPIENDTEAYIQNMATWLGVDPDARLNLFAPGELHRALTSCMREEDGEQPYTDDLIESAANAALQSVPAPVTT